MSLENKEAEINKTIEQMVNDENLAGLRSLFDKVIFEGMKVPKLEGTCLKVALLKNNRKMLKFLGTWGGELHQKDLNELKKEYPDQYPKYLMKLRSAGVKISSALDLPDEDIVQEETIILEEEKPQVEDAVEEEEKTSRVDELIENPVQEEEFVPFEMKLVSIGEYEEGQIVEEQGIYLGEWMMSEDEQGNSLKETFNAFADYNDLKDENGNELLMTYNETLKYVAGLKGHNGYDGNDFTNNVNLYKALKEGTYNGGWVIPTAGTLKEGIYKDKNKGSLKDSFNASSSWHWSCTERSYNRSLACSVDLTDGIEAWDGKDYHKFSTRLIRLVPKAKL